MGPIQSIADLLSLVRRRLPLILTVLVVGLLWSLYMAVTSPPAFEARAVIQVNAPVVADPVTRSAPPAALRVQQIEQRLMSRENLVRLIDQYDLFAEAEGMPISMKLLALRDSMRIESVASSAVAMDGGSNLASIVISARAGTAEIAAAIANDLANDVVTSDRRDRDARIGDASGFLRAELKRVGVELDAHDKTIADFATENEDSLPESRTFIQAELVGLSQRETLTEQSLMELQRERLSLERTAVTDDSSSIVQQLRSAEVALAQARRTLPEGHPEIARLEETISGITDGSGQAGGVGVGRQLSMIDTQIANLEDDLAEIAARRGAIDAAQNNSPQVVKTYEQMQRTRQGVSDQYAELSRRLAEIDSLRLLSENDQTENMAILEPAIAPEFPLASNRKRSAILGGFLSIIASAGLALALDLMNPVLRNARQFESITGLRPVVSLAYRPTQEDEKRSKLEFIYVVAISLVGLIAALWMIAIMPGLLHAA